MLWHCIVLLVRQACKPPLQVGRFRGPLLAAIIHNLDSTLRKKQDAERKTKKKIDERPLHRPPIHPSSPPAPPAAPAYYTPYSASCSSVSRQLPTSTSTSQPDLLSGLTRSEHASHFAHVRERRRGARRGERGERPPHRHTASMHTHCLAICHSLALPRAISPSPA